MSKFLLSFLLFFVINGIRAQTFTNPLLPTGADPYSYYKDGFYYYTHTTGNGIDLWKSKSLAGLKDAPKKTIWKAPRNGPYSKSIWAPEVMFIQGKWYAYFAADDGKNENHRMYVLENSSADPMMGDWVFKGQVADKTNKWAIDGDIISVKNKLYMVWSGWEEDTNGEQGIYIATMKNPWTIDSERVKISTPTFDWEKHGDLNDPNNPPHVNVNEGPQFLVHDDKIFIIFSASGCWTDYYALGMLSGGINDDFMKAETWKKHEKAIFLKSEENGVYAPGHNSFFKSPDGEEDWILYHANDKPGQGCGVFRSPRAQKFTWNADGTPNFGIPVKTGVAVNIPSN